MTAASMWYEFRIAGYLDPAWATWFGRCRLDHTQNGETILTIEVRDQPDLHAVLTRLRDLRLTILAMRLVPDHD